MCAPGTEADTDTWTKTVHEMVTKDGGNGENTIVVAVASQQNDKGAVVNIVFAPAADAAAQFPQISTNTSWQKGGSTWYFHGTNSLDGLPKSAP